MRSFKRICVNCYWISENKDKCPLCLNSTIPASNTVGTNAGYYYKTQNKWINRQMDLYRNQLKDFVEGKLSFDNRRFKLLILEDLVDLWQSINDKDELKTRDIVYKLNNKKQQAITGEM